MRQFFEEVKSMFPDRKLSGAEIGVFLGGNADDFILGLDLEKVYLVDSYSQYNDATEAKQTHAMRVATERFSSDPRITFIVKDSVEASKEVPDMSLDFVYIDANHSYASVLDDINSWYPKVRLGGFIGGHDFDSSEDNYGVSRAVIAWCVPKNPFVNFRGSDWWIVKCHE